LGRGPAVPAIAGATGPHTVIYREDRIQASTGARSTRAAYVTPVQLVFVTNEFTPSTMFVSPSRIGPLESPNQVPPLPPPGFARSFRNSSWLA
jgi:hypothetical protein